MWKICGWKGRGGMAEGERRDCPPPPCPTLGTDPHGLSQQRHSRLAWPQPSPQWLRSAYLFIASGMPPRCRPGKR